jgi:hypothetical protein
VRQTERWQEMCREIEARAAGAVYPAGGRLEEWEKLRHHGGRISAPVHLEKRAAA